MPWRRMQSCPHQEPGLLLHHPALPPSEMRVQPKDVDADAVALEAMDNHVTKRKRDPHPCTHNQCPQRSDFERSVFFYFGLRYKVQKRLESQRPKGAGTIIGGLISGKGGSEVALAWSTTG